MEDNEIKFWLGVWISLAGLIVAVVVASLIYCANVNWRIADAIAHGADPLSARCAFSAMGQGESAMCTAIAITNAQHLAR